MHWIYKPLSDSWRGETARLDVTLRYDAGESKGEAARRSVWHYKVAGGLIAFTGQINAPAPPGVRDQESGIRSQPEAGMDLVYKACEEAIVARLQSLVDEVKAG